MAPIQLRYGSRRPRRSGARSAGSEAPAHAEPTTGTSVDDVDGGATRVRTPAAERRRGVETLLGLWADVARDLHLIAAGGMRSVHDTVLIDELAAIAATVDDAGVVAFMDRTARSAEWLAGNVSPELVLDSLVLAWPRRVAAA